VAAATVLGLGAIGVVLAVVPSPLFDLDRFAVAKESVLLATAALAVAILPRRQPLDLGIAEAGLTSYAVWSAISAAMAGNHWLAARSLGLTLGGLAIFLAARSAAQRGARTWLVGLLVLAVASAGFTGLAQAYGWSAEWLADSRAPGGTLGNRNFLAHLMVLGIPLAGWLLATTPRRIVAIAAGAATSAMIAAVVLSRSRAAWVGFAAALLSTIVVGALSRGPAPRLPRARLRALAMALGVGALAAVVVPNNLQWRSSSPYRDSLRDVLNYREGSGRGRLIQYRNSLELVRRDPVFGVGPGNWLVAYPSVTTEGDPSFAAADPIPTNPWPSSDWIALISERGLVGGALWLLTVVTLGIIALRRVRDPDHAVAALAAIGLLVALTVQGLFDAVILLSPPATIAFAGVGALVPPTRGIRPASGSGRRQRWLGWLAVLLLGFGARSVAQLQSIRIAGDGVPVRRLERAARWDPGSHRLHLLLAMRLGCPAARWYATRAAALLPHHPWPRRLVARCR
jgi:O-antigen ligase